MESKLGPHMDSRLMYHVYLNQASGAYYVPHRRGGRHIVFVRILYASALALASA